MINKIINIRETITDNACKALKKKRIFFKLIECPYVFDFIQRDWKQMLTNHNFGDLEEYFFFKGFVRLLKAEKLRR